MNQHQLLREIWLYRAQRKLNEWLGQKMLKKFHGKAMTTKTLNEIERFCKKWLDRSASPLLDSKRINVRAIVHTNGRLELVAEMPIAEPPKDPDTVASP